MENNNHLKNVGRLVEEIYAGGIDTLVLSPGSRNAPLSILFSSIKSLNIHVVVDERSAGFMALGMAQQLKKPVVMLCTSGSASLNYAPAIAEAYYMQIPLLVLTADRPLKWLNNSEGQQINQTEVYKNYCAASFTYDTSEDTIGLMGVLSEAMSVLSNTSRPVHINIPLAEPLYDLETLMPLKLTQGAGHKKMIAPPLILSEKDINLLNKRVVIAIGCCDFNEELNTLISDLNKNPNVVVICETTSNLIGESLLRNPDLLLPSLDESKRTELKPNLLISIGTHFISKHLKVFLRTHKPEEHWHIDPYDFFPDTFEALTKRINSQVNQSLKEIKKYIKTTDSSYASLWGKHYFAMMQKQQHVEAAIEWSELKAFKIIYDALPKHTILHLGNSMPVRYAQYLKANTAIIHQSNRGTSGIDGSLSTAVGAALTSDKLHVLIIGDLSFMYDSNALWQQKLPDNLKIIILNNGGGGIFKFIKGPDKFEHVDEIFCASHSRTFKHLAVQYAIPYKLITEEKELKEQTKKLYKEKGISILEISTNTNENTRIIKTYINSITNEL